MQALQVVLLISVVALALTLIGYLLRSRLAPRSAPVAKAGMPEAARAPAPDPAAPVPVAAGAPSSGAALAPGGAALAEGGGVTPGLICPACRRDYPLGLKYCPHDARALVPAGDPAVRSMAPGVTCPTCKRSFDSNKKFCPYDAEELVPLALASAGARAAVALPRVLGKICPHCAQRYESEATFCGRDGSELVSVN